MRSAAWRGSVPLSFPFLITLGRKGLAPAPQRSFTERFSGWLTLSGVLFTCIPTSNAMTMIIISCYYNFYHHCLTGRKLPLPLVKRTYVLLL